MDGRMMVREERKGKEGKNERIRVKEKRKGGGEWLDDGPTEKGREERNERIRAREERMGEKGRKGGEEWNDEGQRGREGSRGETREREMSCCANYQCKQTDRQTW